MPMSALVTQFRSDHLALVSKFGIVEASLKKNNPDQARALLREIKDGLLKHLGSEEELYRKLGSVRRTDARAGELYDTFSSEMVTIGKSAMAFFEKYETAALDSAFLDELQGIVRVLAKRIYAEENILYPHYDRVVGVDTGAVDRPTPARDEASKAAMILMLVIIGAVVLSVAAVFAMVR